jgi:hypothetical protein
LILAAFASTAATAAEPRRVPVLLPGAPSGPGPDLAGWTAIGATPIQLVPDPSGAVAARLVENTTLISPAFTVDPRAQTLAIPMRSRGSSAVVEVSALPGVGAPIALGIATPGPIITPHVVNIAGLAGQTVRLQLDPTPTLGGGVEVFGVGPISAPLPGWTVRGGAPTIDVRDGRPELIVDGEPLDIERPAQIPGPGIAALLVAVRGEGHITVAVNGRAQRARLSPQWRDIRVPVPSAELPATLRIQADPGGDQVALRDIGLPVRRVVFTSVSARRSGAIVRVRGTLRGAPAGSRLAVIAANRQVGSATVRSAGRFRARVATRGARLVVTAPGTRTRLAARTTLRVSQ